MQQAAEVDLDRLVDYKTEYCSVIKKHKITGDNLTGLCPFHDDRANSFSVDLKTGMWHCFAEDEGGNFVTFYAKLNGLDNCRFIAGDVLKVLDNLTEKPDVIVLDPPRDGIHPKALPKILSYGVNRIVYVSCKATSLARDLEAFLAAGYRLEKACCVDQFCETVWTEAVALLVKE